MLAVKVKSQSERLKIAVMDNDSKVCWLLACLTSQQHASVSQGRICVQHCTFRYLEIDVADQTANLTTQSQHTIANFIPIRATFIPSRATFIPTRATFSPTQARSFQAEASSRSNQKNRTERRNLRFSTISSLRREPFPTRTLK